ncbi:DUF6760 family protein [Phormidium sp. CCY1219]
MDRLHQEVATIAFYFHWSLDEILSLEHAQRHRWNGAIAQLKSSQ